MSLNKYQIVILSETTTMLKNMDIGEELKIKWIVKQMKELNKQLQEVIEKHGR